MHKSFSKNQLYLICFLVAFIVRLFLTFITIGQNESIDLAIYRDAGQLVANGVNPYDFTDNIALRDSLRRDSIAFNEFTCENQARWNYSANSNLPLATLIFGAIEYSFQNAISYRIIFSIFDSLLSVFILAFILNFWKIDFLAINYLIHKWLAKFGIKINLLKINSKIIFGFLLGALNPIILLNGTIIPEHKGMGIFFILVAIYFSLKPQKKYFTFLSAISLGFSISFIGLGVFIAPFCFYNIYRNKGLKMLCGYIIISGLACLVWLIPFMPELYTMMEGRISSSSVQGLANPLHSSFWVIFHKFFGENWLILKKVFMFIFIAVSCFGFYKKRINEVVFSAVIIYFFVNIFLIDGSMDRMNIGLLITILLLGSASLNKITIYLFIIYFIYGILTLIEKPIFAIYQEIDGYFNLLFTILFTYFIFKTSFAKSDLTLKNA